MTSLPSESDAREQKPASSAPAAEAETEFVSVGIDDLVLGRELRFPVYDRNGVLLLAEGSLVTSTFREKLREREIKRVRVHTQDTVQADPIDELASRRKPVPPEDRQITQMLRRTVEQGLQFVTNSGSAARESRVWHHTEGYDRVRRRMIRASCQQQTESLEQILAAVDAPEQVNASALARLVEQLLQYLCEDFDCVNAVALELSSLSGLAQRCYRTGLLGMSIAIEMGLNDENVSRIGVTGFLHDWGMLKLPEHIRDPAGPLSETDLLERQKHVIHTVNLLERVQDLPPLVTLVTYQVHELMNGTGYPRGRRGNNIHLFARILNVAQTYVELTTPLHYRPALTPYEAMLELLRQTRQGKIDAVVLRALLRAQSLFPVGSCVILECGQMARVIRSNGDRFTQPIVQLLQDEHGQDLPHERPEDVVDLADSDWAIARALPIIHGPEPIPAPHFLKSAAMKGMAPRVH